MNIETLLGNLTDFLRDKMPTITGIDWDKSIYPLEPRTDAKFPRISITPTSTLTTPIGIGRKDNTVKTGVYRIDSIELGIWVKKGNIFTIGVDKKGSTRLLAYLGDQAINCLLKDLATLKTSYGIIDVVVTDDRMQGYMDEYELFRRTITVSIEHKLEVE